VPPWPNDNLTKGSPPHTRGIPLYFGPRVLSCRFTPAYAGNTEHQLNFANLLEVHPRIRGEYKSLHDKYVHGEGSPPHTRGIRHLIESVLHRLRFTPAYAGNTLPRGTVPAPSQVHPRIRGEYLFQKTSLAGFKGSPPHTRGILLNYLLRPTRTGFTPAYAGNTCQKGSSFLWPRVHPRIRGEYADMRS